MEHNQEYYDKEFGYYTSKITRGDLESLPCPFCTDNVSDDVMQSIIMMTHLSTKQRLGLSDGQRLNLKKEKNSEVWWEELESAVRYYKIPYYEDLPEDEAK